MGFFGLGNNNNDAKEDQAVVSQLQALTTAVTGLQATVTGLRNNVNVLIGRIDKLMATEAQILADIQGVQDEATAEAVDVQKLSALEATMIANFQAWIGTQPTVSPEVTAKLASLLSAVKQSHAAIVAAGTATQAADPGPAPVPTVNP